MKGTEEMTTKYVIGIDGGTQSSKVIIFDERGNVVCEASEPLAPMYTPRPGVAEHPDDDLYDSIVLAARRAMEDFNGDLADIAGVGLCTIRCCRALVKKDGTLAAPVQSWMDLRLSRPYEHEDDSVAYVTTTSGYLMERLTGSFSDTVANYIGPWPMDVEHWDWFTDRAKFDSFQIPHDMLFELQMPGEVGGHVSETFAAATGVPAGLPVVHTANDKATEALGSGLVDPKIGLVSLGTYIAGMVIGDHYVGEADSYFTNFAAEPNRYIFESGGIRRGMWTVSWLRNLVGAELVSAARQAGKSLEEQLNDQAERVPAGSDGLMCVLDWLASPTQPHKKGMFIGFDERHGYPHMYRAILEGIAFRMRKAMVDMLSELDANLDALIVSGGGSNSDVMMQIFADVFGLPVTRNKIRNAAGLGAAVLAAAACGVYPDLETAGREMVHEADRFVPDPDRVGLYRELADVYDDIAEATDAILERTYHILSEY